MNQKQLAENIETRYMTDLEKVTTCQIAVKNEHL
jgi:hypothetical protein